MSLSTVQKDKSKLRVFIYSVDGHLWDEFNLHIDARPSVAGIQMVAETQFEQTMGTPFYIDLMHNSIALPTNKKLTDLHLDSAFWWEESWNEEIGMYAVHAKLRPIKSQL
ncbi:hypothetical protein GGH93_005357 [Coemansia aciculifera]|nr:hypothetical protein GGH93_005357 [Coemansia aciculifera]